MSRACLDPHNTGSKATLQPTKFTSSLNISFQTKENLSKG